jgi:hypothetical protein
MLAISKMKKNESQSRRSTEEDSSSDKDDELAYFKTKSAKHKT